MSARRHGREFCRDAVACGVQANPASSGRQSGMGMDVQIRSAGGSGEELTALGDWLASEDELRGRLQIAGNPVGDTELGSIPDLLTVALGTGGAGTVLASSLITWLQTRRTTAKITVESAGRSITLDIQTVGEVAPLLRQILRAGDDD
jgi:Effector Associated Constant Component 1